MNPQVSIILRCRNNWQLTKSCIDSIKKTTDTSLYRLILVDDGSIDETFDEVKKKPTTAEPEFIYLRHEESMGAIVATNYGIDYVLKNPTPYILILDNDTEILEGNESWLNDMIKYFEDDEAVGMVGAVSDNVSGLQHVSQLTNDKKSKFLISFCMMMSLKCVKKVGMMDELFSPMSGEDLDYSIRATRNGFKLKVAKDVFIKHHCHQTLNQNWDLNELTQRNERKLLAKWGERIYYGIRQ